MGMGLEVSTISAALLDYRFGWRWLLPYVPGQRLYLSGFDKAEKAFWFEAVASAEWVQESTQAEGWIISTDDATSSAVEGLMTALPETVKWVVCSGKGKAVRRLRRQLHCEFDIIHEYGLLPAANPRLVVPFTKPNHAVSALALHRPGRWTARMGVWLATMLAQVGIYYPLRHRVLLIASHSPFLPVGALQAGLSSHMAGEGLDFALYLGTPGDNRKTVALPLGEETPAVLIKISGSTLARQALQNEAAALAFLANPSPQSFYARQGDSAGGGGGGQDENLLSTHHQHGRSLIGQVPRMLGLVENECCIALYQEYRRRLNVRSTVLEEAVIDFLAKLSIMERRSRPLREVLDEMIAADSCELGGDEESAQWSIWRWLKRRAELGVVVYEHRSHGDFAPWNCTWTAHGFFVFDWEESRPLALAFSDAYYFALAPALHVAGIQGASHNQEKALTLAGQVAKRSFVATVDLKVHFALWLVGKQATHPGYARIMVNWAKELSACAGD